MRVRVWGLLFGSLIGCGSPGPAVAPPEAPPLENAAVVEPPPPPPPRPTEPRYAATAVRIAWAGVPGATAARTEGEARALAEDIRKRAEGGEDISALARDWSDGAEGRRGGSLGVWLTGAMDPAIEDAVAAVDPGKIAPIARTEGGFYVLRRDPISQVRLAQIVVAFQGSEKTQAPRTREAARLRAEAARAKLEAGEPFAEVAKVFSDDPSAASGGDVGTIAPGQMVPAVEAAAFALAPGERSDLVEAPYGFHILLRLED